MNNNDIKICRYCGSEIVFTSNSEIYGREYGNGKCYLCRNCKAYVGVHTGTTIPLGTLADKELQYWRKQAHKSFDSLWRGRGKIMTRGSAYFWLSEKMGLPQKETHIGMFEKEQCQKVIELVKERRK